MADGLAVSALATVVVRSLALLRVCAVLFEIVIVAACLDWYLTPAHLVIPLVAACWGAVFAAVALMRGLGRWLAVGEAVVGLLIACTITLSVPHELLSVGGANWALLRVIGACVTIAWCAPLVVWLPATLTLAGIAVLTTWLEGGIGLVQSAIPVAVGVALVGMFAVVVSVLRTGARQADDWLASLTERLRGGAVAQARERALRESDRVIHDTVLNTLIGIAWDGLADADEPARSRCRRSVTVCEDLLAGLDERAAGVVARIGDVLDEARVGGLSVDVAFACASEVPGEVAAALSGATREALSNVRRHAGVTRARVDVRVDPAGACVTISDQGRGFVPRVVAPDRLGIRRSIMDRMADVGGSAEIRSAAGRTTTVTLRWSPRPVHGPESAPARRLAETFALDSARGVGYAALLWQASLAVVLLARIGHFREPGVVLGLWAVGSVVLAWCVRAALSGRLRLRAVVPLVVVIAVTQLAAGALGHHGDRIPLNWALACGFGTVAFLMVARPAGTWVTASALTVAVSVALVVWRDGAHTDITVAYLGGFLYAQLAIQVVAAALGPIRRATAQVTAGAAAARAELAADLLASVAIRRDRHARLLELRSDALPLLADLGVGRLDPRDPAVRRRCGSCAAVLRRTLTGQPDLLAALEPAVRAAERRGVTVQTQVTGALDTVPRLAAQEVAHAFARVLDPLVSGQALITVIGGAGEGSAFITVSEPPGPPLLLPTAPPRSPTPDAPWTETVADTSENHVTLEVRWHAQP
jgi:signal transduction histidine kinase